MANSGNNTNSLYNKFSRYIAGGVAETNGSNIEWWERTVFPRDSSDIPYVVENVYEGRLELIATVFYDEPRWWWVIAQYNNILDPFSEVTAGRILMIPTKTRVTALLGVEQGGVASSKQPVNTISPIVI